MTEIPTDKLIEVLRDPSRAAALSHNEARRLWLDVNALAAHLMARWAAPTDDAIADEVLNVADAAAFAHVSESFIYEHAARLPSAFRAGRSWRFHKKRLLDDIAALGNRAEAVEPVPLRRPAVLRNVRRVRAAGVH